MSKQRTRYSAEFKQDAVSRMAESKTITGLAKELGIRRKFLYLWREQFRAGGKAALEREPGRPRAGQPAASTAELRVAELERLLGRKQLELDFFKRTFEQVRGAAANRTSDGGKASIVASEPHSHSKVQD
jgi:transposase